VVEENEWQYLKRKTLPIALVTEIFVMYLMFDFMRSANNIKELVFGAFFLFVSIIATYGIWDSRIKTKRVEQ